MISSPNILAIDTSSEFCSVALQASGMVGNRHSKTQQSHSEQVLPMVRALLDEHAVALEQIDVFAVGVGPGGFTGVRLGVAVAQGLAYAMAKPVVALSSLSALAVSAWNARTLGVDAIRVYVANDARMNQVYWALYELSASDNAVGFELTVLIEPSLSTAAQLNELIQQVEHSKIPMYAAGNAFDVFEELRSLIDDAFMLAPIDHSAPNALSLLPLALMAVTSGQVLSPDQVAPLYVRDKIAFTIAEREAKKHEG